MIRAMDRIVGSRTVLTSSGENAAGASRSRGMRLRWALADDYEVIAPLGAGSFGSVWRVRDLSLGREVALKLLHPHVARDERAVALPSRGTTRRAAGASGHRPDLRLGQPRRRGVVHDGARREWIGRRSHRAPGPRPVAEIAPQIDGVLTRSPPRTPSGSSIAISSPRTS